MNIKKIVLLTTGFPYGYGENFIEAEMESIPDNYRIEIVPYLEKDYGSCKRLLPENVVVNTLCSAWLNRWDKIKYAFRSIFHCDFWKEMCKKDTKRSTFGKTIGFYSRALCIKDKIEKFYKTDLEEDNIVLYSYWLLEGAYAISLLKKQYGCKAISRAHRVDIWDGESGYGIVPAQEYALENLDGVYVCSRNGCQYLQNKFQNSKDVFKCGYLGTQDYGKDFNTKARDTFVVVSCARMEPVKQVHLLAEALSKITDKSITWLHFGDGSERSRVEDSIKKMPSNIKVELKGTTPHEQVMKFYQVNHIDLFVNTSSSEGLPVSIMEAISFGIPVIATDVGGTREITNSETGILLPEKFSVDELANDIMEYIEMNDVEYINARKSARLFWENNFSAEKNYTEFYRELVV